MEEHFTPAEIAERWKLDAGTVVTLFRDEPDVVRICNGKPGKRRKVTLRIPASVVERVHRARQATA